MTNCCWLNVFFLDIISKFYFLFWTKVNLFFSFKMNSYFSTFLIHHLYPLCSLAPPYPPGLNTKSCLWIFSLLSTSGWLSNVTHATYVSLTSPLLAIFSAPALVQVFIILMKDFFIYPWQVYLPSLCFLMFYTKCYRNSFPKAWPIWFTSSLLKTKQPKRIFSHPKPQCTVYTPSHISLGFIWLSLNSSLTLDKLQFPHVYGPWIPWACTPQLVQYTT